MAAAVQAQDTLLALTIADTVSVADYDEGYYVAGTRLGKLYVVDELGGYTITDLGRAPVYDVRIEYPYVAVAADSTVIQLQLGSLTPTELWRKTFSNFAAHEEVLSTDVSSDGSYVAYFLSAKHTFSYGDSGEVGILMGGGGGGALIDSVLIDGSPEINWWLDATADMEYIAVTQPYTDGVDYWGYEAGTALYHFDGSDLTFLWWKFQEIDYEVTEVRISENKDYIASATSSGTFMHLLSLAGDSLGSHETPCHEQFACDGDDNLNYVIGATKDCEPYAPRCPATPDCPPHRWFILKTSPTQYTIQLQGTMDDPIDDLDATQDGSYVAFGSNGGDFIVLKHASPFHTLCSGDVGKEIGAIEMGSCGRFLLAGKEFLTLYNGETDTDHDGVPDICDNCPNDSNPDQEDFNPDTPAGAACEDTDHDGIVDAGDGDGDRDGDGIPNYLDYDPTGYFYNELTGELIMGCKLDSVSCSAGPGHVTIVEDGTNGFYQFFTDNTPGTYTLYVTLRPSVQMSWMCPPQPVCLVPGCCPGGVLSLGAGEDDATGFLTSNLCTDNPYYMCFNLSGADPMVINNNFPLHVFPALSWGDTCMNHDL